MATQENAIIPHYFTIDHAVAEWLVMKENRTHSKKTLKGYQDTMQEFRDFLGGYSLDLLNDPIDIARLAGVWAGMRSEEKSKHSGEDVSPSTYNLRLAILSTWYTFVQEQYKLDIPNPIKGVKKRPVQAYASAESITPDAVEQGLDSINRNTPEGLRDYALLAVALYTGRRASELAGLRGRDVKIQGRGKDTRIKLTFHCKGAKIMHDLLDTITSAVLLDYMHMHYSKQLLRLPDSAPIWVSFSRQNKGKAIGTRTLSNICAAYMGTSKVHALRHTFAVGMIREGAPITDLAGRLGHTDIKITQLYAKEVTGDENIYGTKLSTRFGIKRKGKE